MTRTTVIAIVLAILVLGAAAYMLFGRSPSSTVSVDSGPASEAELTFINLTAQIDPVTFDTAVLEDPRFIGLQDIRTAIIPEASGRPDPFAQLPGTAK